MIAIDISAPIAALFLILLVGFICIIVFRKKLFTYVEANNIPLQKTQYVLKIVVALICIPAGFLLVEFPYNTHLFEMDLNYVALNLLLFAVFFVLIFSWGQRTKTSMVLYLLVCFIAGVASHFVALFKGQPILPSDVAALQTAAAVGGGYTYVLDDQILQAVIIFEILACLIALLPTTTLTKRTIGVNIALAACISLVSVLWFSNTNIEEEYQCSVDVWSSLDSYQQQGALLCFLQRSQQLAPQTPQGYSHEEAINLRNGTSITYNNEALSGASLEQAAQALDPSVQPSIVVIMNETFSDISQYQAIDKTYDGIPLFRSLCNNDALLSGNAYVSALGGGTCNSEFEFLTGSTTGILGAGVYPYMLYDLQNADNLAQYLSNIGYETTAIHPASASNWRRDRVYQQLGFDTFYDITSFSEDVQTRRGLVTDAATYDVILDKLTQSDTAQFIFDVTIANHSGYDTGEISEEDQIHTLVNGESNSEVDEYISCIRYSDIEFYSFINSLKNINRPVIVCMFGDHQPGFADELAQASLDKPVSEFSIEETQMRYNTPYIIWTNNEELRKVYGTGNTADLSLNYLGSNVLKASGLPLDEYFAFNKAIEQEIPAINLNGYQDSAGIWYWQKEESDASTALEELAIVQHDNLFN